MMVARVKPRRFDCHLGTHVEDRHVQHDLESLLILTVPARTTQRHEGPSVAQHDGWTEGCSRSLAALNQVGMIVFIQHERLHPVSERYAGVSGDEDATEEPA